MSRSRYSNTSVASCSGSSRKIMSCSRSSSCSSQLHHFAGLEMLERLLELEKLALLNQGRDVVESGVLIHEVGKGVFLARQKDW